MAEIRINATGELKLYDSDDSNYVSFKSAGTVSSNVAWVLPSADGSSGQALTTDGSGTLSWATASSADPSSADGDTLGTASAEWSDLYLADGGIVYFGNDQDIRLTHNADKGLIIKHAATADDKPVILTLQTGETDMAQDDVMGKIEFQAPDEGTGTDAILVSAAIQAVAEGNFSSSSNATRLEFMTGSSEAATSQMTISSGGIVGIGAVPTGDLGVGLHIKTADSGASANSLTDELVIEGSGDSGLNILSGTSSSGAIYFGDSGDDDAGRIVYYHGDNSMRLVTSGSEVMRLTSDKKLKIGTTSGEAHALYWDADDSWHTQFINGGSSANAHGIDIDYSANSPNGSGNYFINCQDSANPRFRVASDGDCQNDDNSYGAISDERIKQNITDASSQWDDIKALKVRKYRKKEDVRVEGESAHYEIGLVAQEAELVSPKLISEAEPGKADITSDSSFGTLYKDGDEIPDGKKIGDIKEVKAKVKAIKYSILYMKAIKALQEAQTRIETLETKVKTLEDA